MEKPSKVEVGQRWQLDEFDKEPHVVVRIESEGDHGRAWFDDKMSSGCERMLLGRVWSYHGYAPTPPQQEGPRVMGERGNGKPERCLMCGDSLNGCAYVCDRDDCLKRVDALEYTPMVRDWRAGARDFPRSRTAKGSPEAAKVPSPVPSGAGFDTLAPPGGGKTGGISRAAPITRREVSTDGKHWVDFSRLTDGDAFEAYPWRRTRVDDGDIRGALITVAAPPPPREETAEWKAHVTQDEDHATCMSFTNLGVPGEPAQPSKALPLWQPSVTDEDCLCADAGTSWSPLPEKGPAR